MPDRAFKIGMKSWYCSEFTVRVVGNCSVLIPKRNKHKGNNYRKYSPGWFQYRLGYEYAMNESMRIWWKGLSK